MFERQYTGRVSAAVVVLAGVEDATLARAESHYYLRFNSKYSHHPNFSLVSIVLKVSRENCVIKEASGTAFVFV